MDREQFVVLYLNMKLHPIGVEIIAIGGSYECNVEIKNVFEGAIVPMRWPSRLRIIIQAEYQNRRTEILH